MGVLDFIVQNSGMVVKGLVISNLMYSEAITSWSKSILWATTRSAWFAIRSNIQIARQRSIPFFVAISVVIPWTAAAPG